MTLTSRPIPPVDHLGDDPALTLPDKVTAAPATGQGAARLPALIANGEASNPSFCIRPPIKPPYQQPTQPLSGPASDPAPCTRPES
jgi:hypothetical protein